MTQDPDRDSFRSDEPDKGKRPRSGVGTVMSVLILILIAFMLINLFGEDNSWLSPNSEMTQMRFWEKLYTGDIRQVEQEGELHLTFELRSDDPKKKHRYTVEFPKGVLEREYDDISRFVSARFARLKAPDFLGLLDGDEISRIADAYTVSGETGPQLFVKFWLKVQAAGESHALASQAHSPTKYYGIEEVGGDSTQISGVVERLTERFPDLKIRDIPVGGPNSVAASQPSPLLSNLLYNLVPWVVVICLIWFVIVRQVRNTGGGGGVLSFGRSRAQMISKEKSNVTFDHVAGVDEAKEEVREIIEFLKNPARFSRLGGRIPRGVLLVGPPGTGKTLLAKAIAGEANVPFFSISGSDFVEMFVGVGASRVRDLFRQAREHSPCLVFLDEIDAVGRKRGSGLGGGHDEREQTLNAILVEMDGFETDEGIILVAATNRPDVLDPALLRPGRFDRQIQVGLPDVKGREAILSVHTEKVKISSDIDLATLARATPGFSGAELAAMVNEAALIATLRNGDHVEKPDFEEARDKVRWGRQKKNRVMEEKDRRETALHEAGHALIAHFLPEVEPLHKVTIVPRGMSLGATMVLPEKDRYNQTRREILGYISFAYGGRCAEELFCDDISTGAYDDIRRATELARQFVCQWGMSDNIGPISYAETSDGVFLGQELGRSKNHSESMALEIDREIKRILVERHDFARQLLAQHREALERVAKALLKYETLTGAEVSAIVAGKDIEQVKREEAEQERLTRERKKAEEAAASVKLEADGLESFGGAQPNPA